jgi:hypothetical protein
MYCVVRLLRNWQNDGQAQLAYKVKKVTIWKYLQFNEPVDLQEMENRNLAKLYPELLWPRLWAVKFLRF